MSDEFEAKAARCWCDPTTSMLEFDSRLALVFAKCLRDASPKYPSDEEIERTGDPAFEAGARWVVEWIKNGGR